VPKQERKDDARPASASAPPPGGAFGGAPPKGDNPFAANLFPGQKKGSAAPQALSPDDEIPF
jgi:hypothetical protein